VTQIPNELGLSRGMVLGFIVGQGFECRILQGIGHLLVCMKVFWGGGVIQTRAGHRDQTR
jgi:hypothetical protein